MPSQDVLSARFSILIRHVGLMLKQHIPDAPMWQRSKMRLSHSRFLRPSGFMLQNAKKDRHRYYISQNVSAYNRQ